MASSISGLSDLEKGLRKKLLLGDEIIPDRAKTFRELGAFWQHWTLHQRVCSKTGKNIISVFGPDCPYPVWHKDEWMKDATPPSGNVDLSKSFFPQLWEIFRNCPIPHNIGSGNENCEYTDDCWYSKNCYLCHSLAHCEDLRYCYRILRSKDCMYCVFCADCELCADLVNCLNCFNVKYSLNSQQCRNSAFLFDCRNCEESLFCWNLRNKKYCYFNQQLSKEEFEAKKKEWNFRSRSVYQKAIEQFQQILREKAWLKSPQIVSCEQVSGDYLEGCKNCQNCYFCTFDVEDCVDCLRTYKVKDCLMNVNCMTSELIYYSSGAQDQCYDVRFSYNLTRCRFAEYSAFCFQSEHIFGCCGLVGKKYYIFNKPYTPEQYHQKKKEIIDAMIKNGEYGQFFPGYFAAHPYEESFSSTYFPLEKETLKALGYRSRNETEKTTASYLSPSMIPDNTDMVGSEIFSQIFWDDVARRRFQISKLDMSMVQKLGIPLPWSYYARRIQENFRLMPFSGKTCKVVCAKCKQEISTSWSHEYATRVICQPCYLKEIF